MPYNTAFAYVQPKESMHRTCAPKLSQHADCRLQTAHRWPRYLVPNFILDTSPSHPDPGSELSTQISPQAPAKPLSSMPAVFSDWIAGHATRRSGSTGKRSTRSGSR